MNPNIDSTTEAQRHRGKKYFCLCVSVSLWFTFSVPAAQIRFAFTNHLGTPDTNRFRVVPIGSVIQSDGSFITRGIPTVLRPSADGKVTNSFEVGHYHVTNQFMGRGFLIRVPEDQTATIYDATSPTNLGGLAMSGYNTFVTVTPTYYDITNAIGTNALPVDTSTVVAIGDTNYVKNTNGLGVATALHAPTMTNAINYGNAFRSPGSAANSEEIGSGAAASGVAAVAFGGASVASANSATAIGTLSEATAVNSSAFGADASASATGSTALGVLSSASHENSTAIGAAATTTATEQIRLGYASQHVSIPGALVVDGIITGHGSGISNAVDLIAGNGLTIQTNANKRSFTPSIAEGVTNQWKIDATNAANGVAFGAVLTNENRAVIVTNTDNFLGGSLVAPAGSVGSPSIKFSNDADTGLYSSGANGTFSVAINGVNTWEFGDGAGSRVFRPTADNTYDIGEVAKRVANIYGAQFIGGTYFGAFTGNGNGLTNLNVASGDTLIVNGKLTLNSNVFVSQLSFATNAGAVNVLTLNCTDQFISTNNNIAFTGFNIPAEYGVTNSAWASVIITNNSASAFITLTFAGCIGDTTHYVTNQSAFTVKKYPGAGTNVVANNLK